MNIYELEKQATPGPLSVTHRNWGEVSDLHRIDCVAVASAFCPDKNKADAQLLAHCRNNFMRALEALKLELVEVEAYQARKRMFDQEIEDSIDADYQRLKQLITKLETVEGV